MDLPHNDFSSFFADNLQQDVDQPNDHGVSDFSLPMRPSSSSSKASQEESSSLTSHIPDQASDLPSPALPAASNSKKRRRETMNLSSEPMAKNRRATPSPALSGNTTPVSLGSVDFSQDPQLVQLLGGNPRDHMAEMMEEHRAQEREYQAKKEQERRDEEFARQLHETFANESSVAPSYPQPRTSQSFFDYTGRIRRPDLHRSLPPPPPTDTSSKQPSHPPFTFNHPPNHNTTLPFQLSGLKKTAAQPALGQSFDNFIDLGSDDEDEHPQPNGSAMNRGNFQLTNPSFSQESSNHQMGTSTRFPNTPDVVTPFAETSNTVASGFDNLGDGNIYRQPWDELSNTNDINWADTLSGLGQSITDLATGAFSSAFNVLGQNSSYVYAQPTNSGAPVIDLDSYDEPQPNLTTYPYQHPAMRSIPWDDDSHDRYMERLNYLTNDPTKTAAEIKDLLENIRPDEELPMENREGTPDALVYPLYEHQKLGLAWMKSMEEGSNKGGILADDMGLGKTVQALALMVTRRSPDANRKTTLIVAPLGLMKQWEEEIKSKLKPGSAHRLTTYTLHGSGRRASWEELSLYDVVLTTYGTLSTEIKRKHLIDEAKRKNPNWKPITKADHLPLLGDNCKWYRVILDEAQCIKNKSTKAAQGACELQSLTRICMSGTPMQNGVAELFSLIQFLRIKPYNDFYRFNTDFIRSLKSSYESEKNRGMQKLQALLKAILLRRNKKSTIDGKPILTLPERTTESRHAQFSEDEQEFYKALETQSQLQFNKYLRAGTVGKNYSNVLVLLLRLRQACCHPHLIKDFGISSGGTGLPIEDLVKMAKELAPGVVIRLIDQLNSSEQVGLECPVCMDATENATIFIPCGHNTCSECFARISDPSQAIANGDAGGTDLKCPQCRGKITASSITDHNTFRKVHMGASSSEEDLAEELQGCSNSESETDDETTDDEGSDLGGFVVKDDEETTDDEEGYRKGKTPFERCLKKPGKKKAKSKKAKGKDKAENKPAHKSIAQLKKESLRNAKAKRKYLARLRKTWESSAKIDRTMEVLREIQDRKEGEKTIIFSQFTSLLDLLEVPIVDNCWKYTRYDGSMSAIARNEAVSNFTKVPECKIMLVSLRAGNSGLNLVAASQVIIMDPFWNPYVEEQAVDRAHRIGQQRPVQVHRMLIPGTVEDRILNLQEKKRAVIESALDENASREVARLGVRELGYLFVSIARVFFVFNIKGTYG
ncbi:MAG: hypothetical protein Q9219_002286 [cf. Caloplaca sp. 3 TL-2023]